MPAKMGYIDVGLFYIMLSQNGEADLDWNANQEDSILWGSRGGGWTEECAGGRVWRGNAWAGLEKEGGGAYRPG